MQNQSNSQITFDTQLKTALYMTGAELFCWRYPLFLFAWRHPLIKRFVRTFCWRRKCSFIFSFTDGCKVVKKRKTEEMEQALKTEQDDKMM